MSVISIGYFTYSYEINFIINNENFALIRFIIIVDLFFYFFNVECFEKNSLFMKSFQRSFIFDYNENINIII